MCGIFGIYNPDGMTIGEDEAGRMFEMLSHRGPDGRGSFRDDRVYLGHTRLSIIDVEGGRQPLFNEDGNILVIGNGEIYNHAEIRRELEGRGHRFTTRSDFEVLVHLFEEEKERLLDRLNGMFAFAVYNRTTGELFLARDRIGIKPLYYYHDGKRLIFSSEMKAIVKSGLIPLAVDNTVVYQYLTLHFSIPPDTIVKGLQSLLPGHYCFGSRERPVQKRYWDIETAAQQPPLSYGDAYERIETLLRDSVAKRLMSDVPLGLFLSGGIDSSLVAAFMHDIVGPGIRTFSIGYREKEFSELPYARRVSEMISSDHTEVIVTPKEIMDNIGAVIWHRETPISEPADIPIFLLSRAASQNVKVVLTGEGGDEVFAGYRKYIFEEWARRDILLKNPVSRTILRNPTVRRFLPQRLGTAIDLFSEPDRFRRYYRWFSYFRNEELSDMVRPDRPNFIPDKNFYAEIAGDKEFRNGLDEMQYLDIKVWLPDNLLLRGDRMSMAWGLEARVPFLDHRLVELSFRLPRRLKIRNNSGKYIIKKIAENHVSRDIVYRRKVGFSIPVSNWLRGPLSSFLRDHLTRRDSFCGEIFTRRSLETLIEDHVAGRRDNHKKLWILLNLELWRDSLFAPGGPPERT